MNTRNAILIVEDDPASRKLLDKMLQRLGYETICARDGREAWQMLQQHDIRLVVTDWMMPEMDGVELCRTIRSAKLPGYVYVIFLTALDDKTHLVEALDAGADDYLAKPLDPQELRVRVRAGQRVVELQEDLASRLTELWEEVRRRERAQQALADSVAREKGDREALEATLRAAWEVTAQRTEDAICVAAVDAIMSRLEFDRAGIWLTARAGRTVVGKCGTGREPGVICDGTVTQRVEPGSLVARLLSGEAERYVTEDYSSEHGPELDEERMAGVGWYAAVSLKVPQGVIGYVSVDNLFSNRPMTEAQLTRLELFAQNVANAILSAREVADRVKAEKLAQSRAGELEVLTRLLNTARDRTESVIESVGQGIVSLGNDGQIHSVNREAARILEREAGQLVGQTIHRAELRFETLPDLALAGGGYPRSTVLRHGDIVIEASAFRIRSVGDSPGVILTLTDITERARMQGELEEANRRLAELAVTDVMTGLANHRRFQEEIARQIKLAQRASRALSLLMVDVDDFKRYNDEFGHPTGDKVLGLVAGALAHQIRESDLAARYGGEEFAVILVETGAEGAVEAAERVRSAVAELSGDGMPAPVTVSVGVATFPSDGGTPSTLIEAADRALYAAKQTGRNKVCTASESQSDSSARRAG